MKQRKYFTKICAMLFLIVAFAATSVYAQGLPPYDIQLHFAIGFQYLNAGMIDGSPGINARFWSDKNVGFDVGWARNSIEGYGYVSGSRVDISINNDIIPASLLYTVYHGDTSVVYIRPYVGGGFNISRISASAEYAGSSGSGSDTKIGGQGFGGVEFTFKAVPRLSFGGDVGYYRIHEAKGSAGRFLINFYLK